MASKPSPTSAAEALAGLNIRGDLTSDILPKLTFSPTIGITTARIDKLGLDIRSFREPLKRSIQRVIAPSIVKNFDSGGRPNWQPLSEATLDIRRRMGFGGSKVLVRSGLLRRTMGQFNIWNVSTDTAIIANLPDKVWYGAIHQEGLDQGSMKSKGSSRKALQSVINAQREAMRTGKVISGRATHIPQRQFVMLQDEDVDGIYQVFAEWLEERIERTWGGV